LTRFATDAINTSGADTFEYYYTDGSGGWQYLSETATQINNTQYDNGGTLSNLTANRYRTDWLYLSDDGDLLVLLGTNNSTLADAQAISPPTSQPPHIRDFSTLIAKVIVKQGGPNLIEIDNLETSTFSSTGAVVHNETTGKQRGTTDEYYHLTAAQATVVSNTSGTNTGDQTLPVKATGAELDTGTDNDKFATAKALKDSHNVPSVAPGTSGNVLTSDGTDWTSAAAAGGGQTCYDAIVAATGGDYTTLGAAIAAGATTIFVHSGTYTEGAITSSTANITIVGANPETTVLSFSTNSFTMSGAYLLVTNIKLSFTTGIFNFSGNYSEMRGCHYLKTGAGYSRLRCDYGRAIGNTFIDTSSGVDEDKLWLLGSNATNAFTCVGNTFNFKPYKTTLGTVYLGGAISGNFFIWGGAGVKNYVKVAAQSAFTGNTFRLNDAGAFTAVITGSSSCTINDNVIWCAIGFGNATTGIVSGGLSTVVANNMIYNCSGKAIVANYSNCTITGNNIYNQGSVYGIGVEADSVDDTLIANNTFRFNVTGINIVNAASDRTIIDGNKFITCTTNIADAGTVTTIQNNSGVSAIQENKYMYMKNTSGGAIAAGNLVTRKAVAAGDEVTMVSTTAGDPTIFGMAAEAIADTAYGYIQVLGKTTLLKVNGTTDIAIGDYLSHFTTAGIAQKAASGHTAIAIALKAYTTDDSSGVIDAIIISPRLV